MKQCPLCLVTPSGVYEGTLVCRDCWIHLMKEKTGIDFNE